MRLDQGHGAVLLVLHVGAESRGQRADVLRQAREAGGGKGGVDPGDQRVDAGVLGLNRVEHGYLARPGDLFPQRRPELGVLCGVMDVQLVLEGRPAGAHGRIRDASRWAAAARRRRSRWKASCAAYMKVKSTLPRGGRRGRGSLSAMGTPRDLLTGYRVAGSAIAG